MSEALRARRPHARTDAAHAPAAPSPAAPAPAPDVSAWAVPASVPALFLGGVQRKPVIGRPGDAYEREADAVADRVAGGLSAPAAGVSLLGPAGPAGPPQAKEKEKEKEKDDLPVHQMMEVEEHPTAPPPNAVQAASADPPPDDQGPLQLKEEEEDLSSPIQLKEEDEDPAASSIQLKEEDEDPASPIQLKEEDEDPASPIQLKEEDEDPAAPSIQLKEEDEDPASPIQMKAEDVEDPASPVQRSAPRSAAPTPAMQNTAASAIASPGTGSGLPATTRGTLETRMGVDLGGVRVHEGPGAHKAADGLHARAFTHGRHIWIGRGESAGDVRLMAHEVTHVLQQDGAVRRKPKPAKPKPAKTKAEAPKLEAEKPEPEKPKPAAGASPAAAAASAAAAKPDAAKPKTPPPAAAPSSGPAAPSSSAAPGAAAGAAAEPVAVGGEAAAGEKPAAKAGAKGGEGKAAPGGPGAAGPAGAGGGGGGGAGAGPIEPLMPEPPAALSPAEQARLAKVDERAGTAVAVTTDLPPAEEQVAEAQAAVEEPAEETRARAGDQLVDALGERPAPSPEIEELCKKIYDVIEKKRPPDEDSLVEADPEEMAKEAGGEMNASVEGDTQKVQGEYDQLQEQPEGTPALTPVPLEEPPPGAPPPDLAADAATPEGVPPEAVSLDADVEASEQRMADAGMESEPAKLVQDGPIAEAREAQGELTETAARDPQEVLAEQQATLSGAQGDMAALQASALAALEGSRDTTTGADATQQGEMKGSEEEMRTAAATEAQRLFNEAQTRVSTLLDPLPATAMKKWEAGVQVLSTEFEQHLAKVKAWVDERHESTAAAVFDYFAGLPDWVTEEYDDAERTFGDGVCNLIREISREVNGVIAACEAIVDDSRTQIAAVFDALPDSLDGWAAEQQALFGERLNGLQEKAQQVKADFTKDLTKRAGQAVQDVRAKVHELREAAKGLIGRIADAINAFLDDPARFIINGLLSLLGISPASFWAVVEKIGAAIDSIADDPMNFVNNLMDAVGQGFSQFFDNIGEHLLQGLLDWLFSGLGSVGVTLPADMSLKSIITFFLQLMGLSWANIKKILEKHVGEENVALIEKAWELISNLIELGPEGLFELIKEQLDPASLLQMVLDAAVDYLIEAVITAVTPRILLLFNPVGAIVQAIEAIFRVLKWIFENAARIFSLIETIVNGITDLIAGNVSGMADAVEGALAKLIPPVIDFLAGYLGLGGLPEAIADVIKGFQEKVLGIVDRVIGFLVDKAKGLLKKLGLGEDTDDKVEEEDPEKADRVRAGLGAIETEEAKVVENGRISHVEAVQVAAKVRADHPVFKILEVVDGGDKWKYHWEASPGEDKETEAKKEEGEGQGEVPDGAVEVPLSMMGEGHTLTGTTRGGVLEITIASRETIIGRGLRLSIAELQAMPDFKGRKKIIDRLERAQYLSDPAEIMMQWNMLDKEQGKELPQGVNTWPKFLQYKLSLVIAEIQDLAVADRPITALTEMFRQLNRNNGPYAHLVDPHDVAPFTLFSDHQRDVLLAANISRHGQGVIISDESGIVLDDALPRTHPRKPNIDHMFPQSLGGSNSYSNAMVIARNENSAKRAQITLKPGFGTPAAATTPAPSTVTIRRPKKTTP
ncbi:MAG TPA: DUF4157 domain-containing protein [Longimicrobium sp.]|nr:DUF4157 domain-containing protein [Longimicrobium sp.]